MIILATFSSFLELLKKKSSYYHKHLKCRHFNLITCYFHKILVAFITKGVGLHFWSHFHFIILYCLIKQQTLFLNSCLSIFPLLKTTKQLTLEDSDLDWALKWSLVFCSALFYFDCQRTSPSIEVKLSWPSSHQLILGSGLQCSAPAVSLRKLSLEQQKRGWAWITFTWHGQVWF